MISILIVEDNSEKIRDIKNVLFEYPEIQSNLDTAPDTNGARRLIEENKYDLLILDLVLPNDFGDDPSAENGVDFLKEIKLDPNKKLPFHILGISSFSDLVEEYSKEFKKNLWYLIEYKAEFEDWKDILRNKIEYLITSKKEITNQVNVDYNFDVAIITALQSELDKVLLIDAGWRETKLANDGTSYNVGQIHLDNKKVVRIVSACAPQMGMSASSTLTMKLINGFKPRYIIMSGIAAGIKGEVELGDILVCDQCWDGASGKIKKDKEKGIIFLPDPKCKILNEDVKEKILSIKQHHKYLDKIKKSFQGSKPSTTLNVHIGPMASVPAVIQSEDEINKIKAHSRKLIGIEMESYGMFYSSSHCQKPKPIPISVKSVADFANEDKNDSYHDYASYTSSQFIFQLIKNELEY
jgi:nucleoside phosphorylase/CheY-like chemotaxis protein